MRPINHRAALRAGAAFAVALVVASSWRQAEPDHHGLTPMVSDSGNISLPAGGAYGNVAVEGTIQTTAVGRKDVAAIRPAVTRVQQGSAVRDWGWCREEIHKRREGLEQLWRFDSLPPGSGPLTVRLALDGLDVIRADDRGIQLADRRTGARYRYGLPTWVEGSGSKTGLKLHYDSAGGISITVPEAILEAATYPAILDPLISSEFDIAPREYFPSGNFYNRPAVATDGKDFLLVWLAYGPGGGRLLLGARVTADGLVLDPDGFLIGSPAGYKGAVGVGFGGGNYLVVWDEFGATGGPLRAARVTSGGEVLDSPALVLPSNSTSIDHPIVTHSDSTFLIAWRDCFNQPTYHCTGKALAVSDFGVPMAASATHLTDEALVLRAVGANGQFMVVWSTLTGTMVQRLTADGLPMDPNPVQIVSGLAYQLEIASDGFDYLVAWTDGNAPSPVFGTKISSQTAAPSIPFLLSPSSAALHALAFDGNRYLIGWSNGAGTFATRVEPAGKVNNPAGRLVSPQVFSLISCAGRECLGIVEASSIGVSGVRFRSSAGALSPPFPIILSPASQSAPFVASRGSDFFVAWSEDRPGAYHHPYGARVSAAGSASRAVQLWDDQLDVLAAASTPAQTLILGVDSVGVLRGIRVAPNGNSTSATPFQLTAGSTALKASIRAASIRDDFLVAWDIPSYCTSCPPPSVRAMVVMGDGGLGAIDGIEVGSPGIHVSVAAGTTDYLVTWDLQSQGLFGTRVSPQGVIRDTPAVRLLPPGACFGGDAKFDFDGTNWVAAWRSPCSFDVQIARVSQQMGLLDGNGITVPFPPISFGWSVDSISFDGAKHVLVARGGVYPNKMMLAEIEIDGGTTSIRELQKTRQGSQVLSASSRTGTTLLVNTRVERFDDSPPKVVGQLIDTNPAALGAACQLPSDCLTGACLGGICCTAAGVCAPTVDGGEAQDAGRVLDAGEDKPPQCERTLGVCVGSVRLGSRLLDAGWPPCGPTDYGPHFQSVETFCDGLDNDCNGVTDEYCPAHPSVNEAPPAYQRPTDPGGCGCGSEPGLLPLAALGWIVALRVRQRSRRRESSGG